VSVSPSSSAGPGSSFSRTEKRTGVSSVVSAESSPVTGGSFTELTVKITVALAQRLGSASSQARYVNESGPLYSGAGV
jgi:hypothetical protein